MKKQNTTLQGHYEAATLVEVTDTTGKTRKSFDDTDICILEKLYSAERTMVIEGKVFKISSFFPLEETSTATNKLLKTIDNKIENDLRKCC